MVVTTTLLVRVICESGYKKKHFHDCIMSLAGEIWAHKAIISSPLFYWSACTKPEKWAACICVLGAYILPLFLRFTDWILELLWRGGIFSFSYYFNLLKVWWNAYYSSFYFICFVCIRAGYTCVWNVLLWLSLLFYL